MVPYVMSDGALRDGYRKRTPRRTTTLYLLGLTALGACGLVLLGLGTSNMGGVPILVGALAALIPVFIVVQAFLWVDRWEPEPPKMLVLAFVWGACGAALAALLLNSTAEIAANAILGGHHGDLVASLVSAPLFEEGAKGAFLLGLLLFARHEFDGVVDGIVYGGIVAAGFAFSENIRYFAVAFEYGGFGSTKGVVAVFVLRGVFSPFIHPLFTVMTGIGFGVAARTTVPWRRWAAPLIGYLVAVCLHALWNGSVTIGGSMGFISLYFYGMVPLFLAMVGLVLWSRRREQGVVETHVGTMAREGLVPAADMDVLCSMASRRQTVRRTRRRSGRQAAKATAVYHAAVTELAFLRRSLAAGVAGEDGDSRHERMIAELAAARRRVEELTQRSDPATG
jgi:RsiW-degrading membrane proteinase PrsW (M82 family)